MMNKTSRNDHTGDLIKSKSNGDQKAYEESWERIFGNKQKQDNREITENDRDNIHN